MTCKHENRDHLFDGMFTMLSDGRIVTAKCEQLRCLDCGAWLPLGPSSDGDPRVAIEVRAAEIAAATYRDRPGFWESYAEGAGFDGEEAIPELHVVRNGRREIDRNVPLNLDSPSWRAGYLARAIVTHGADDGR